VRIVVWHAKNKGTSQPKQRFNHLTFHPQPLNTSTSKTPAFRSAFISTTPPSTPHDFIYKSIHTRNTSLNLFCNFIMPSSSTAYPTNGHLSTSPAEYDMDSGFTLLSYTRSMHQHTKEQMDAAARSARRRSPNVNGTNAHGTLGTESTVGSMDSTRSARS